MTTERRDGHEEPFNMWVRNNPLLDSRPDGAAISITDLDFVVHQYIVRELSSGQVINRTNLMFLELKTHGKRIDFAQRDTLGVLNQGMNYANRQTVHTARGDKKLWFWGLHLLTLSGRSPSDSEKIMWNRTLVDIATLTDILRFRVDPHTIKTRTERNHHKTDQNFLGFT